MKYNPDKHHRKSIRLKHYDYSQAGFYFVTIVVQHRQHVFGNVENGAMIPNAAGEMIEHIWHELPDRFPHVSLDAFMVMPNHVHGIIVIHNEAPPVSDEPTINTQTNNKTTFDDVVGVGLVPTPAHANHQTPLNKTQQINDETAFVANDTVGAGLVPAPAPATNELTFHKIDGKTAFVANHTAGAGTREAPTQTETVFTSNDFGTDVQTSFMANATNSKHAPLGDVVGVFKSLTTHVYILGVREQGWTPFDKRLWQRNYYERIIRTDDALTKARAYIEANPQNWETDNENTTKKNILKKNTEVNP